jgi:hypothetical protein
MAEATAVRAAPLENTTGPAAPGASGTEPVASGAEPLANGAALGASGAAPAASGAAPVASGTEPVAVGPPPPRTSGSSTTALSGPSALRIVSPGIGGPSGSGSSPGPTASGPEAGEPISVDEFQGDVLGRNYCVQKTSDGEYFFDYAKPPADCDLTRIKFFRVTGASIAEVEAELKSLLGKVKTPSSTAPVSQADPDSPPNSPGAPYPPSPGYTFARPPEGTRWPDALSGLRSAAGLPYTPPSSAGLVGVTVPAGGGNGTRKKKPTKKVRTRRQQK